MYIRSDQEAKLDNSSSATNSDEDVDVPVLVIGAGPTGLLTAYMLSKLGGTSNDVKTGIWPELISGLIRSQFLDLREIFSTISCPKSTCPKSTKLGDMPAIRFGHCGHSTDRNTSKGCVLGELCH